MARELPIPEVDLSAIQAADLQQVYWMLYKLIMKDFVHKDDLKIILAKALVNGGSVATETGPKPVVAAQITADVSNAAATAKGIEYETKAKTGASVREGLIEGLEKVTA